jgi:PAS domain S-box-containing protein
MTMRDSFVRELLGECRLEYVVLDAKLRILRMSKDAAQFAETPHAVVVGGDVREAFPEIVGAEHALTIIADSKLGEWNVRNVSRAHVERNVTLDLTIVPTISYSHERLALIIEDVTERAAIEQKLLQHSNETKLLLNTVAATKNYYQRIFEGISDALLVCSPDGIVHMTNAAATRLFGVHKGELVGAALPKLFGPDCPVSRTTLPQNVECLALSHEGGEIPVAVSSSIIENGEREHIVVLARDLREKKHAEAEISKLHAENLYLNEEVASTGNFFELIGTSAAMKKIFKQIEQAAPTDSTILLLGETGTGKELIARALHRLSPRKEKILVKVNCAALPENLVESELFGHEKGAFTGADARRIGRFEHADGGTILLDEIGDLPLAAQAKLLRVLQEKEFERVGGNQHLHADVRVIAATNRTLEDAVHKGRFRDDLYYRINVFPIHVPPLREHREDVPLLVQHFIKKFAERMKKRIVSVDKKAMDTLIKYDYPGNVRELAAIIERAVILCKGETLKEVNIASPGASRIAKHTSLTLEAVERRHILAVLGDVGGIIEGPKGAAVRLGINPSTLRSRMKKLGIRRVERFSE